MLQTVNHDDGRRLADVVVHNGNAGLALQVLDGSAARTICVPLSQSELDRLTDALDKASVELSLKS